MSWRIRCDDWTDPIAIDDQDHAQRLADHLNGMTFSGCCPLPHTIEEITDERPAPEAGIRAPQEGDAGTLF